MRESVSQLTMSFLRLQDLREFHSAYLNSLGRAMAVCQHFEDCGRHVSAVWAITGDNARGLEWKRLREIALKVSGAPVARCLQQLAGSSDFDPDRFEIVDKAREARNWFAHEAADCICFPENKLSSDLERIRELHSRVAALCAGTAILAIGSYEICEREHAAEPLASTYRHDLQQWVFEPMIGWFGWLATV